MKAWVVHLMNCFPNAIVIDSENSIDVHSSNGHQIALRKGDGHWIDESEKRGLPGRFSLSPIPKEARVHKLNADGTIGLDDEAKSRMKSREQFLCSKGVRVLSIEELIAKGYDFEKSTNGRAVTYGKCVKRPESKRESEVPQE